MVASYPYGYQGGRRTLAQLDRLLGWQRLLPAVRLNLIWMFDTAIEEGVDLGIGGGGRDAAQQAAGYAKDPNRFAKPGYSYHESDAYLDEASGRYWAVAADLVPASSFWWVTANCERFGFINFPNSKPVKEPWHVQPASLPRSRRLYVQHKVILPSPPGTPLPDPYPAPMRPTVAIGSRGSAVMDVQRAVGAFVDGWFGPKTRLAVRAYQRKHGLFVDGIVGPQTWKAIDSGKR